MTLFFCQIEQLTTELAALDCLKINVLMFKLVDKEEMYNILDVFEIQTTLTCPCLDYQKTNKLHLLSGELLNIFV